MSLACRQCLCSPNGDLHDARLMYARRAQDAWHCYSAMHHVARKVDREAPARK